MDDVVKFLHLYCLTQPEVRPPAYGAKPKSDVLLDGPTCEPAEGREVFRERNKDRLLLAIFFAFVQNR